jgi:transposase-like protein
LLSRTAKPKVVGMETAPKRKRRRFSAAERQQLLAAWRSSGESAARFGQQHDVRASNLIRWAAQSGVKPGACRSNRAAHTGFVELTPAGQGFGDASRAARADLEIEYPNGLKLRASRDVDAAVLAHLASALGAIRTC